MVGSTHHGATSEKTDSTISTIGKTNQSDEKEERTTRPMIARRICGKCKIPKRFQDFHRANTRRIGFQSTCKNCTKQNGKLYYLAHREKELERNKEWREKNKEHIREKDRTRYANGYAEIEKSRRRNIRILVLSHYSLSYHPKCFCCGENNLEFLGLHHSNGGGNQHRQSLNSRGHEFYRWIIRNNFPTSFGVLCHNCNLAKGFYGYCPHERRAE